jgi:hypothetical protein
LRKNDEKPQIIQTADFGQITHRYQRIHQYSHKTKQKQKVIAEISTSTKVTKIALKVAFKLVPFKTAFSKIRFDIFFNNQKISSKSSILQGPWRIMILSYLLRWN